MTAANADSIGTVNLSWDALPEVTQYTVGWLANEDWVANRDNDVWKKYFAYSNVGDVQEWTVSRLTPGIDYLFIACGNLNSDAPVCTGWTSLTLTASPEAICPTGEPVPAPDAGDYDADDDGLIEIINLAQLDAIRHDSDGDGVPDADTADAYAAAFPGAVEGMGCSSTTGCKGYELMAPLDFDTNGNGEADAGDAYWNNGDGWEPIPYYQSRYGIGFDGNSHAISNLYISRSTTNWVGLFGQIAADVQNVVLEGVNVTGGNYVGALAGENLHSIYNSAASGEVTGFGGSIGGLVGTNAQSSGSADIRRSSADVSVTGLGSGQAFAGGLTGSFAKGTISDSSATGNVVAADYHSVGGLVGGLFFGTILSSTASGNVTGKTDVGNLVGRNEGTITNSQGTGQVTCSECP